MAGCEGGLTGAGRGAMGCGGLAGVGFAAGLAFGAGFAFAGFARRTGFLTVFLPTFAVFLRAAGLAAFSFFRFAFVLLLPFFRAAI